MQEPTWASGEEDAAERFAKLNSAPRASDDFMVMPSVTTAAEAGPRPLTPDITSQPRSHNPGPQVCLLKHHCEDRLPLLLLIKAAKLSEKDEAGSSSMILCETFHVP